MLEGGSEEQTGGYLQSCQKLQRGEHEWFLNPSLPLESSEQLELGPLADE